LKSSASLTVLPKAMLWLPSPESKSDGRMKLVMPWISALPSLLVMDEATTLLLA